MLDNLRVVAGNLTEVGDLEGAALAEEVVALAVPEVLEASAFTKAWFLDSSSASTDMMVLNPLLVFTALFSFFFQAPSETTVWRHGGTSNKNWIVQPGGAYINVARRVPAQDVMFALILWYVAKSIFRS